MKKNKVVAGICLTCVMLTGCGDSNYEAVKNIESVVSEGTVTDYSSLSDSDKQAIVYQQVSNRKLIDLTSLDSLAAEDYESIEKFAKTVVKQIDGAEIESSEQALSDELLSYVQWLFQRTPYTWEFVKYDIKGIDNGTSSVVIDLKYNTTKNKKPVKPDSTIVYGSPSYTNRLKERQELWNSYLEAKYGSYGNIDSAQILKEFKKKYGDLNRIMDEQSTESVMQKVKRNKKQFTYTGLVNSDYAQSGASMTLRIVVEPAIAVGIKTGYMCRHIYMTDYSLDKDFTSGMQEYVADDSKLMQDKLNNRLYSYLNCIDEHNFTGLYSLMYDFASMDRYFRDYFSVAFSKNSGFSAEITDIKDNTVSCIVNVTKKERSIGTNMAYPCYKDKYFMTLKFKQDDIYIDDCVLISSLLQSEPAIKDEEVEEGFNAIVELTNEDKMNIEKQLGNFAVMHLIGNYTGDEFYSVVDNSLSTHDLGRLKETLGSVQGVKKILWLNNYTSGKDGHASVRCKEVIQKQDLSMVECMTNYDLLYIGNKWLVSNYEITSVVKLEGTVPADKGSLFTATPEGVSVLNSQVVEDTGNNEAKDDNSDSQ